MKNLKQSPFGKEFYRAGNRIRKICDIFNLIDDNLKNGDIEGAYTNSLSLEAAVEKLALSTRQLPKYTGNPQAQKMCAQVIADTVPVSIGFTPEGWFGVVMPALLPKKNKGTADYISEIMYPAMQNFFRGKQPVRYTDCVIIFRHIYQHDRPERQYRDHDNIEVKAVTDIIALYVLFDDSPLRCSNYHCSAPGNENRTEIFIIPQNEFGAWITNVFKHKNKEIILHENRP